MYALLSDELALALIMLAWSCVRLLRRQTAAACCEILFELFENCMFSESRIQSVKVDALAPNNAGRVLQGVSAGDVR